MLVRITCHELTAWNSQEIIRAAEFCEDPEVTTDVKLSNENQPTFRP